MAARGAGTAARADAALENVTIPLIVPGTVFAICRRTPYPLRRRSDLFEPHIIVAPPMRAA
jgi:hypothetical protein